MIGRYVIGSLLHSYHLLSFFKLNIHLYFSGDGGHPHYLLLVLHLQSTFFSMLQDKTLLHKLVGTSLVITTWYSIVFEPLYCSSNFLPF